MSDVFKARVRPFSWEAFGEIRCTSKTKKSGICGCLGPIISIDFHFIQPKVNVWMTYLSIDLSTQLLAALFSCANWPQSSTRLGRVWDLVFRLDTSKVFRLVSQNSLPKHSFLWLLALGLCLINIPRVFETNVQRPYSFISSQMKIQIGMRSLSNHYVEVL